MFHLLKRHLLSVRARLRHCLVLGYAFPRRTLEQLLPPGLELDGHGGQGFLAAAFVQAHEMRPAGVPAWLGRSCFLIGYRIFARFRAASGETLRGLYVLRSDTDSRAARLYANIFSHYQFHRCSVKCCESENGRQIAVNAGTVGGEADVDLVARLWQPAALPAQSPFASLQEARHFAGPLPITFEYETRTRSILRVRAIRHGFDPQPVAVDVRKVGFLDSPLFASATPVLANAFYAHDVSYYWERGICERPASPDVGTESPGHHRNRNPEDYAT